MPNTVETTSWGYRYVLEKGDIVEVGDSRTPDFKAHVKTIRDNAWFSLGSNAGIFTPSLNGLEVSFDFNANIQISIYPVNPSERLPDGGIEYDIKFLRRFAGNTSVTLDIDWQGITWHKILGLDVEYDQAKCVDTWPKHASQGDFVITPTQITSAGGEVLKTRKEYEVNSYEGLATTPRKVTTIEGVNPNNGFLITHTTPSVSHLHIHRGQMTDALGHTAWVEDINIDESAKTITFTLPREFLRIATYPINQVCGVDPSYAQGMLTFPSSDLSGDGVWTAVDLDNYVGGGFPDNAVVEVILSNGTAGTENTMGVRANGSSLARYVTLHEAEGGGQTHCRMFVQADANGVIEAYHSDISDGDLFYLVGYWYNVTFTERADVAGSASASFTDTGLIAGANAVHQLVLANTVEAAYDAGARANGSALTRSLLVHEAEAGGASLLDWLVKSDADNIVELKYNGGTGNWRDMGYFDSAMDFVEKWQDISGRAGWPFDPVDITAYLDQDGRMIDSLLVHKREANTDVLGIRDGDDSSTVRSLTEHEAESAGAGGEYCGFSMSAQSNASGVVNVNTISGSPDSICWLTGYFKPSAGGATTNSKIYVLTAKLSQLARPKTYLIGSRLRKTFSKTYAITARLAKQETASYSLTGRLRKVKSAAYSILARLKKLSVQESYQLISRLIKTRSANYQLSSRLSKQKSLTYNLGSRLRHLAAQKTYSITASLNAGIVTKWQSYQLTGRLRKQKAIFYQLLSRLSRQKAFLYQITARLEKLSVPKPYQLTSRLRKTASVPYTLITRLKRLSAIRTYVLEARLRIVRPKTYLVGVRLRKQQQASYLVAALLKRLSAQKSYQLTASLSKAGVKEYNYQVSARLKKLAAALTYAITARLRITRPKTYQIQSRLRALRSKTFGVAARLSKIQLRPFSVTARLRKTASESYLLAARLRKTRQTQLVVTARLSKQKTITYALLSRVRKTGQESYILSAYLVRRPVKAYQLSSRLQKTSTQVYAVNAKLTRLGATKTYGVCVKLVITALFSVSTQAPTELTYTTAKLHGSIDSLGPLGSATLRGFDWGTASGEYIYAWAESGLFGTGSFEHTVDNLLPGQPFYFRAKAAH